jgi:hypothetical protein
MSMARFGQPTHELGASVRPYLRGERRGSWIAIEYRENERTQKVKPPESIGTRWSQRAFDQLRHQRQPKRKCTSARLLDGRLEFLFGEQHFGIVTGARANIHRCLSASGRLPVGQ